MGWGGDDKVGVEVGWGGDGVGVMMGRRWGRGDDRVGWGGDGVGMGR